MQQLLRIENIYHLNVLDLLVPFYFLFSLESQYMNHHVYNLLYGTFNTLVELNQK